MGQKEVWVLLYPPPLLLSAMQRILYPTQLVGEQATNTIGMSISHQAIEVDCQRVSLKQ